MIILDTNVVLEPTRAQANPTVLRWLDMQSEGELWLTAVTAAELQVGVETRVDRADRERWQTQVSGILNEDFQGRVLPFDLEAALVYATIASGRPRSERHTSYRGLSNSGYRSRLWCDSRDT